MPAARLRRSSGRALRPMPVTRGVLFDLDDTLFDHTHASRKGLAAVCDSHPDLATADHADLAERHARILEVLHVRVLRGEMGIDEARVERFGRLFEGAGIPRDATRLQAAATTYREAYLRARREVPGASALLAALRGRVRLGVVSNNVSREQREKIRTCRFETYLDAVIISEEVSVAKPDPAIFRLALAMLGTTAEESVMIGDSWPADVAGARAAGIRAVWFNPGGRPRPDAREGVAEIAALEPAGAVASVICGWATTADGQL